MSEPQQTEDIPSRIPPNILFGTSSWAYEGWKGIVYHQKYDSEADLSRRGLSEYTRYPWFRTVGLDSTFYSPLSASTARRYADQVPSHFRWASKVWEEITVPVYAKHRRYGTKAGNKNPNFLNASLFADAVLGPLQQGGVQHHQGPFIFEFQTLGNEFTKEPRVFFDLLSRFFDQLPREPWLRYSVELRNRELLVPEYVALLNTYSVAHCFNHWTRMPRLKDQMTFFAKGGGLTAPFIVARILTPLGISYEDAVKTFTPYRAIQRPNMEMRQDTVLLARRAIARDVEAFILVNNRAEGHSPGTIAAIGELLNESLAKNAAST